MPPCPRRVFADVKVNQTVETYSSNKSRKLAESQFHIGDFVAIHRNVNRVVFDGETFPLLALEILGLSGSGSPETPQANVAGTPFRLRQANHETEWFFGIRFGIEAGMRALDT